MKYTVKPSVYAKTDRKNIVQYLEQYSIAAPVKFKQALKKYIDIISDTPNIFSKYSADSSYRHVTVFGAYIMFYTVNEAEKTVLIYRILHGAQDIERILQ